MKPLEVIEPMRSIEKVSIALLLIAAVVVLSLGALPRPENSQIHPDPTLQVFSYHMPN